MQHSSKGSAASHGRFNKDKDMPESFAQVEAELKKCLERTKSKKTELHYLHKKAELWQAKEEHRMLALEVYKIRIQNAKMQRADRLAEDALEARRVEVQQLENDLPDGNTNPASDSDLEIIYDQPKTGRGSRKRKRDREGDGKCGEKEPKIKKESGADSGLGSDILESDI